MFGDEVAFDRFRVPGGILDTDGSRSGSVGFDFKQISLMTGEIGSHIVELLLRGCREHRRSALERDRYRVLLVVLIEPVDGAIDLVDFTARLTGDRASLLGLIACSCRY